MIWGFLRPLVWVKPHYGIGYGGGYSYGDGNGYGDGDGGYN
jgi:hypothetical protein